MIRTVKDCPLVFELGEVDDDTTDALILWFGKRKPKHITRRIENRANSEYKLEIIFDSKADAMEFKLTFL
jgi:hypothetical protein